MSTKMPDIRSQALRRTSVNCWRKILVPIQPPVSISRLFLFLSRTCICELNGKNAKVSYSRLFVALDFQYDCGYTQSLEAVLDNFAVACRYW